MEPKFFHSDAKDFVVAVTISSVGDNYISCQGQVDVELNNTSFVFIQITIILCVYTFQI